METIEKKPLEIIKEKFELTPNENTNILSIKGVNPLDILELLRKCGYHQLGCYQNRLPQDG